MTAIFKIHPKVGYKCPMYEDECCAIYLINSNIAILLVQNSNTSQLFSVLQYRVIPLYSLRLDQYWKEYKRII